ncbi:MAG: DUF3369 domain-containing protein [Gammaproteobacteria bacterium]|jgi:response regulator RpfG family c-di-GMP phosphodiesterase|nr:DUF3369 domain-containing protein [Gammaproteobacteria bacterium]MBT3489516.1 DUF3369 domain-containing protein [Gammaproteobacteria bacterium]MBT3717940.1 DUF3369 domain-containing protein [Gammaproteobacteria bacterium]MBT3845514.1 DUF3369 domain-containing protein [Gammaproteobacteria bacterium]MBT3893614.1 DUF3369 domain-containing protein [Gammaproteobacteria bacterium]
MKIIRKQQASNHPGIAIPKNEEGNSWKLLVVDDEPDIRAITRLGLRNFQFMGRSIQFIEADCAESAKQLLEEENNIAAALIDVVMESDDAGLKLIDYIRNDRDNRMIRLIVRTGQPGAAPEREVVDRYDIDDYKDKTELTEQKLYTTVRTALKGYHDLCVIEGNRQGLSKILDSTPKLYHHHSLHQFFDGVLTQLIGLCGLGGSGLITTVIGGAIISSKDDDANAIATIQSCQGSFANNNEEQKEILEQCKKLLLYGVPVENTPDNIHIFPLEFNKQQLGLICLDYSAPLSKEDQDLVHIMVNQSASALKTLLLHSDLRTSYQETVNMLAVAAEFRDKDTGEHINRVQHSTIKVAERLGLSNKEAKSYGFSSLLHDIGKVAIPDAILQKPDKLTHNEFEVMKQHTQIGLEILEMSSSYKLASQITQSHHERWDGNGYPDGLKGEEIPLAARIVAVTDVFDALTNNRIYKPAWSEEDALDELKRGAGSQFDPAVVDAFTAIHAEGLLSPPDHCQH